ncbi:hypothetical protein ACMDCR_17695 [Labrys okinawensis]|uniref:hypothetical protein n=1 Tax=Labrys okinawensis TaxID=346911 RepID=UPI0039BD384B
MDEIFVISHAVDGETAGFRNSFMGGIWMGSGANASLLGWKSRFRAHMEISKKNAQWLVSPQKNTRSVCFRTLDHYSPREFAAGLTGRFP